MTLIHPGVLFDFLMSLYPKPVRPAMPAVVKTKMPARKWKKRKARLHMARESRRRNRS